MIGKRHAKNIKFNLVCRWQSSNLNSKFIHQKRAIRDSSINSPDYELEG